MSIHDSQWPAIECVRDTRSTSRAPSCYLLKPRHPSLTINRRLGLEAQAANLIAFAYDELCFAHIVEWLLRSRAAAENSVVGVDVVHGSRQIEVRMRCARNV